MSEPTSSITFEYAAEKFMEQRRKFFNTIISCRLTVRVIYHLRCRISPFLDKSLAFLRLKNDTEKKSTCKKAQLFTSWFLSYSKLTSPPPQILKTNVLLRPLSNKLTSFKTEELFCSRKGGVGWDGCHVEVSQPLFLHFSISVFKMIVK